MASTRPLQRALRLAVVVLAAGALAVPPVIAQRRYGQLPGLSANAMRLDGKYDGRFRFARLKYAGDPRYCYYWHGIPCWEHGYPVAEENLVQILDAVTSLHPHVEDSKILAMDDPELLKYPVAYMVEGGLWAATDKETSALGRYLTKGGFLIADDFRDGLPRGSGGWAAFEANMQRALPDLRWIDLTPDDAVFHSFFEIDSLGIIPQDYDAGRPVFRGLFEDNDRRKRMLVMANFNTDVSNWWEYAGQGFRPVSSTNEAYKLGVNYVVYGMVH